MEIIRVKESQIEFFAGVAPAEVMGLVSLPNCGAIGAVDNGYGIGLLVFTEQTKGSITIEWLYVDSKYRGKGAGAMLMETIFEVANKLGEAKILARLPLEDDFEEMQFYLFQWGFGWKKTLPGEWNLKVKDIYSSVFAQKSITQSYTGVKHLEEVTKKELQEAIKKAENNGTRILYDVDKYRKYLDPKLSFVSKSKDGVNGMLLFHRAENVVYPVVFWIENDDPKIATNLLGTAYKKGRKILNLKDIVRITTATNKIHNYVKQLLPRFKKSGIYMMQASTDVLEKLADADIDTMMDGAYLMKDMFHPEDIPAGGYKVVGVEVR